MRKRYIVSIGVSLFLLIGMNVSIGAQTEGDKQGERDGRHCVMEAQPVKLDDPSWEPDDSIGTEPVCFDTFSEAVYFATDGGVQLDPSVESNELTQEMLDSYRVAPQGSTPAIIAIDWTGQEMTGSDLIWEGQPEGCNGYGYGFDTMPSGWDNVVSSSKGYSGCYNNQLYENQYQNAFSPGAVQTCNSYCPVMGAMDNHASSRTMNP